MLRRVMQKMQVAARQWAETHIVKPRATAALEHLSDECGLEEIDLDEFLDGASFATEAVLEAAMDGEPERLGEALAPSAMARVREMSNGIEEMFNNDGSFFDGVDADILDVHSSLVNVPTCVLTFPRDDASTTAEQNEAIYTFTMPQYDDDNHCDILMEVFATTTVAARVRDEIDAKSSDEADREDEAATDDDKLKDSSDGKGGGDDADAEAAATSQVESGGDDNDDKDGAAAEKSSKAKSKDEVRNKKKDDGDGNSVVAEKDDDQWWDEVWDEADAAESQSLQMVWFGARIQEPSLTPEEAEQVEADGGSVVGIRGVREWNKEGQKTLTDWKIVAIA